MLLNKEKFAKEIAEIVTSDDNGAMAIDIHTKKICKCSGKACDDCLFCGNCRALRNKWANSEYVEPIKLTSTEKVILENIDSNFKWIARDNDGRMFCFEEKPHRGASKNWYSDWYCWLPFDKLLKFIKWENEEPYKIEDIISNCEVVEDGNMD